MKKFKKITDAFGSELISWNEKCTHGPNQVTKKFLETTEKNWKYYSIKPNTECLLGATRKMIRRKYWTTPERETLYVEYLFFKKEKGVVTVYKCGMYYEDELIDWELMDCMEYIKNFMTVDAKLTMTFEEFKNIAGSAG